jgi:hypothetical protein
MLAGWPGWYPPLVGPLPPINRPFGHSTMILLRCHKPRPHPPLDQGRGASELRTGASLARHCLPWLSRSMARKSCCLTSQLLEIDVRVGPTSASSRVQPVYEKRKRSPDSSNVAVRSPLVNSPDRFLAESPLLRDAKERADHDVATRRRGEAFVQGARVLIGHDYGPSHCVLPGRALYISEVW